MTERPDAEQAARAALLAPLVLRGVRWQGSLDELVDVMLDEADEPFVAYRRADGDLIYGEYAWMSEHYECGHCDVDDVDEIVEVVMLPFVLRRFDCHERPDLEDDE